MGGRSGEDLCLPLPRSAVTHTISFFLLFFFFSIYRFTCHFENRYSAQGSGALDSLDSDRCRVVNFGPCRGFLTLGHQEGHTPEMPAAVALRVIKPGSLATSSPM